MDFKKVFVDIPILGNDSVDIEIKLGEDSGNNFKYIYIMFSQKWHILICLPKEHKDVSQYPHFPEIYNPFASNLVGHQGLSLMLPLIHVL